MTPHDWHYWSFGGGPLTMALLLIGFLGACNYLSNWLIRAIQRHIDRRRFKSGAE